MDITSALSTITALGELTKMVVGGKVDSEVKAKAAELNNAILTLQGTLFTLQSQNHELLKEKHEIEAKMVKLANWDKEAARYYLHELCAGVFVYALKPNEENPEPSHYLCPNCYQDHRKSILARAGKSHAGTKYACTNPTCNVVLVDHENCASYRM